MKKYILLSGKSWNDELFQDLAKDSVAEWIRITLKEDFNFQVVNEIQPDKIFIPHWSNIIPSEIYNNYECVVFHMTDLPYGRGGSPLQNLIVRGFEITKISALKVGEGLDTGDIYLKKDLSLLGTAEEIFIRASKIIFSMIKLIVSEDMKAVPQTGTVTEFRRRKPEDSDISDLPTLDKIYDYIRMLDAEGYPKAYLDMGDFRLEFSRASLKTGENIVADVRIFKR